MVSRGRIAYVFHPAERYVLLFLVLMFIGWHIISLGRFPLPWFDEVYFSSISQSFLEDSSFIPEVVHHARNNKEALSYGPVFFGLNALVIKFFGSGIIQARVLTLLSGLVLLFVVYKMSRTLSFLWVALLFLTDPFFSNNMHEGRMELMALAFGFGGWGLYQKNKSGIYLVLAAFLLSLSFLTTPRVIIFLVPLLGVMLQDAVRKTIKWYWLLSFLLVFFGIYFWWIQWAFGGIMEWGLYYKNILRGNNEAPHGYLGGNFYIPKHEYLLLLLTVVFAVAGTVRLKKKYYSNMLFIALASILTFYLLIYDWGVYSVLIIPFFYLIIFDGFRRLLTKNAIRLSLTLLLFFNFGYQFFKTQKVVQTWEQRDADIFAGKLQHYIPKGAKVIGSSMVYYCLVDRNPFQLYDKYLTDDERASVLQTAFDYDYLVVAKDELNTAAAQAFIKQGHQRVAVIEQEERSKAPLIGEVNAQGYEAYIYKRVSK